MYNIRKLRLDEFHLVLPMAEAFYQSTDYAKTMPFNYESVLEYYIMIVKQGFILVAEEEGSPIGMIGCIVQPFMLNQNFKLCTEAMWWVDPDYRGLRVAADLMRTAEEEGKAMGCQQMVMSKLSTSPEGVDTYYKHCGYAYAESAYMKEI